MIKKIKLINKVGALVVKVCLKGRFNEKNVFLLASSPRSGSTWLGNALSQIPRSCMLFEPLQLSFVPEAKKAGFSWRTFVEPGKKWSEGETYLRRVFEGKVVNEWTARELSLYDAYKSKVMIIKFVRANQLLPWICETFDIHQPIFLIRHPCAVIASQMKSIDWMNSGRPEKPPYLLNYPIFESILTQAKSVEEYLACSWAFDQLIPLIQEKPRPWIIITYEELLLHPRATLTKIFRAWNKNVDMEKALSKLNKPSSVVYKSGVSGIGGWKQQLTKKQISTIISIVNDFGLGFYSEKIEPDFDLLNSENLPENIRKAGNG